MLKNLNWQEANQLTIPQVRGGGFELWTTDNKSK